MKDLVPEHLCLDLPDRFLFVQNNKGWRGIGAWQVAGSYRTCQKDAEIVVDNFFIRMDSLSFSCLSGSGTGNFA
jgi:hypothetical protein